MAFAKVRKRGFSAGHVLLHFDCTGPLMVTCFFLCKSLKCFFAKSFWGALLAPSCWVLILLGSWSCPSMPITCGWLYFPLSHPRAAFSLRYKFPETKNIKGKIRQISQASRDFAPPPPQLPTKSNLLGFSCISSYCMFELITFSWRIRSNKQNIRHLRAALPRLTQFTLKAAYQTFTLLFLLVFLGRSHVILVQVDNR